MIVFDRKQEALLKPSEWSRESDLDRFLFEFPEALSEALYADERGNRLIPLGTQLWKTDILFLRLDTGNSKPALLVCENKRGKNPERRRKVLAQAVDYVSLLADMDDGRFENEVKAAYARDDVRRIVKRLMSVGDAPLDESDAKGAVEAALSAKQERRIEAVICADDIPSELIRMTDWLNNLVKVPVSHSLITTCEVHPIDGRAERLVALAATVAQLRELNADSLAQEEPELLRIAQALRASPTFQVAIAEVKPLGADRIALQATIAQSPTRSSSDPIHSVEEWLSSIPTPEVKRLFDSLRKALGERGHWKSGGATGDQLGLWVDVAGLDNQAPLLRLKKDRVGLIFPKKLPEFERALAWARRQIPALGAEPQDAAQPTLGPQRVEELANQDGAPLIQYLEQYITTIEEAVGSDD